MSEKNTCKHHFPIDHTKPFFSKRRIFNACGSARTTILCSPRTDTESKQTGLPLAANFLVLSLNWLPKLATCYSIEESPKKSLNLEKCVIYKAGYELHSP